ncbi:hemolysin-III related-domain-containing protein [Gautieria morchelliformis]|nr:hemolysin-III related-domain-containing protein [Gautieria morchelliformis]
MSGRVLKRRPSTARSKRASTRDARSPVSDQAARHLFHPSSHLSPTPKLASLRVAVLDYLKDLENRLSQLEPPLHKLRDERNEGSHPQLAVSLQRARSGSFSASAIDEACARIRDGLEMLNRIRADVCSQLPDLPGLDILPDFTLDDVRSHIPSFEFPDLDLHLTSTLDDVALNFEKIQSPLSYLPTLSNHLESLHEHLLSLQLPSSLSITFPTSSLNGRVSELIHKLQDPDLFTDPLKGPLDFFGDSRRPFESAETETDSKCEAQIQYALIKSRNGKRLIRFQDLPHRFRNDEYVISGYRFIPLFRWPLLLLSLFQFHNETANIWTHLLPLIFSLATLSSSLRPLLQSTRYIHDIPVDFADRVFMMFANICLLSSCVWHVMSGCAHRKAMETAARVDYVGIGWLISASIGSIVYYGFGCRPQTAILYLSVSLALGIAGSILPFMTWFNERKNKKWRIMFFLSLVFTLIIPMAHLAAVHSLWDMYIFIKAELLSLAAYAVGLIFYAFHFPECVVPIRWAKCTDWIGGGSHAIWHLFIVLAIKLHKDAMVAFRGGIGDEMCTLTWDRSDVLGAFKPSVTA